jgi:hypothetical protein
MVSRTHPLLIGGLVAIPFMTFLPIYFTDPLLTLFRGFISFYLLFRYILRAAVGPLIEQHSNFFKTDGFVVIFFFLLYRYY